MFQVILLQLFCKWAWHILTTVDNCIDRHVETSPDRVALIWEKDEPNQHQQVTYRCSIYLAYNLLRQLCELCMSAKLNTTKFSFFIAQCM